MRRAVLLALLVTAARGQEELHRIREYISKLGSPDPEMRARYARWIGDFGPRAKVAIPALVKRLGDDSGLVRGSAAGALEKIGPASVPALVKALDSGDENVRGWAAKLLEDAFSADLEDAHLRALAAHLKDDAVQRYAARALGKRRAVDLLLTAFLARNTSADEAAVLGLQTAGEAAVPSLADALASPTLAKEIRAGAARALGEIKAKGAGESLLLAVSDGSPIVAGAAARALGRTGALPEQGVPRLIEGLRSADAALREGCIDGLAAYGAAAGAGLIDALADAATSEPAALAFRRMGEPAVEPLRTALGADSAAVRRAALATIGALGVPLPEDAIRSVADRLADADAPVRAGAARVLAALGPAAKDDRLRAAAADPDPAVRAAAFFALGELGIEFDAPDEPDPVTRIEAVLATWKNRGGSGGDELRKMAFDTAAGTRVRAAAVSALGAMGIGAGEVDLAPLLEESDVEVRRAAAWALDQITRPSAQAIRESRAAARPNNAVDMGLSWLAMRQGALGEWQSEGLTVGVSGLAVLAFLAKGCGPQDGKYGPTVARGLDYLLRSQQGSGRVGGQDHHAYMVCHGIATLALVEAYALTGEYRYRRAAQRALDHIAWARNPYLAWRYEPRGGENDTHVTTWMVFALKLGDASGLRVDPAALEGAALWIDKMTDPDNGQIGYNYPGGVVARPEGLQKQFPPERVATTTAAGCWCRQILGCPSRGKPEHKKGIELVRACTPRWGGGCEDYAYYHFGALALFQEGDPGYGKWEKAVTTALGSSRDPATGAWLPKDVWSPGVGSGAQVYATAMPILTLLTPWRYPRDFMTKPKLTPAARAAIAALRKAQSDEDQEVRAIAAAACARFGG